MEDEERGPRLSKRFNDKNDSGEVDYKTKAGTAWSHSFLNQKPWHPLSYPNQRRKWIAEQTHAQRDRRAQEVAREYTQEQEFLRQTSLLSEKEKEKVDIMQAVSFMYVRPPGYNAESAKAAEVADQRKTTNDPLGESSSGPAVVPSVKEEKRKPRPKDVFGRSLPTEEEFAVLKNAPRLETGAPARVKPFAIEVRNVKCVRCGTFGHQSGDRECPLKDAIMPIDENRLKRDDPLNAIIAHMDSSEPLKWELKQQPGISPPRGGFMPDDPNQQIVAEEIFDEYGGFLSAGNIPDLLANFSSKKKSKSKSKHKKGASSRQSHEGDSVSNNDDDDDDDHRKSRRKYKKKSKCKKQSSSQHNSEESQSTSDSDDHHKRSRRKTDRNKNKKNKGSHQCNASEGEKYSGDKQGPRRYIVEENNSDRDEYGRGSRERERKHKSKKGTRDLSDSSFSGDSEPEKRYGKGRLKYSHRTKREDYDGSSKRAGESEKSRVREGRNRPETSRRSTHREGKYSSSDNSDIGRHNERVRDRRKSKPERTHRDF